ncbi:MAG TPA: hemolysin, partial [Verrucomicrobiae bacterium]|nr:hemolysin [Verrucomicrobiae bacterium]
YAKAGGARYLLGCSSINSQDPATGASVYTDLCRHHLSSPHFRTRPLPAFDCSLEQLAPEAPPVPKLLRAYLTIGAKICAPPALDRKFKTIDFLTLVDLHTLPAGVRGRFLQ